MIDISLDKIKKIPLLERALVVATICHSKDKDKGGNSYILHPLAVAMSVESEDEKIVGLLHDTVEDKKISYNELRELDFPEYIIKAIDSVTRREGETYMDFVRRSKENVIGRNVKLKDIENNMDISRIPNPTEKDYKRLDRYKKAKEILIAD